MKPIDRLTTHFTFDELTYTSLAAYKEDNRRLAEEYKGNLLHLAENLEELRESIGGKPIVVSSGFRHTALNEAIGGAVRSSHLYGLAADITADGMSSEELFAHIKAHPTRDLAKCISERIGGRRWVHFAVGHSGVKPVFLTTTNGKTYERA